MVETVIDEAEAAKSVSNAGFSGTKRNSVWRGFRGRRHDSGSRARRPGTGEGRPHGGERVPHVPRPVGRRSLCIAGAFGLLGALGTGVRASAVETARDEPEQVGVLMGHASAIGWVLAGLALLVGLSALAWLGRRKALKLAAALATFAFVALTVVRLASLDERAAELGSGRAAPARLRRLPRRVRLGRVGPARRRDLRRLRAARRRPPLARSPQGVRRMRRRSGSSNGSRSRSR